MKAIRIHEYGDSGVLRYEDAPVPEIGPDEVLIRACAAGVNPIDWKTRQGEVKDRQYAMPLILGWDVSGVVEAAGSLVTRFQKGDRVFAKTDSLRNGTYAEYVAVRGHEVAHAPTSIPLAHAAGIPLAAQTAWIALFERAELKPGQKILVHAAAGGVGSFAVQLAKAAGARVIGTASAANLELVRSLGAEEAIDYRAGSFAAGLKDVDVVLDTIGGETRANSWNVLRQDGVLVSVVGRQDPIDEETARRHGVRGISASLTANGARLAEIGGLVDAGKLKIVIDREFPLQDARAAQELSESGRARGKILLQISVS